MTKNKKIIGLFVVCGVLFALAAAKKTFEGQRAMVLSLQKEKESTVVLTGDILPEHVARIILYKGGLPDKPVLMKKGAGDAWFLESRYGVRLREGLASTFCKNLSGLKGSVRAASKDVFSDFKISDEEGLHVVLKNADDADTLHLVFGATMPRWGAYFTRLAGSDTVALIETENLFGPLGLFRLEDDLNDRSLGDYRLFGADLKNADRLDIILSKKETYAMVKTGGWAFAPPDKRASVDSAKVEDFLRIVLEMRGRDAVDPNGTGYGLEAPVAIVRIALKEGAAVRTFEAQLGGSIPGEGMAYVRVLPGNFVYKVPENAALNLKQKRSHFVKAKDKLK